MKQAVRHIFTGFIAMAAVTVCGGCLQIDKTHTQYVAGDGVVTWMVVEKDVRSSEENASKGSGEAQDYITAARTGMQPVARAFRHLGAINVSTQIVLDTPPFTVVTTARFPSLNAIGQALIDAMGSDASSQHIIDGAQVYWAVTIFSDQFAEGDPDADLTTLLDEPWHVVLETGRFVDAHIFGLKTRTRRFS